MYKYAKLNTILHVHRYAVCIALLMEEILHQLIGSLSHYLHGFIQAAAGFLPSTVCVTYTAHISIKPWMICVEDPAS